MKKVLLSIAALFTVATYASAQETGFGFGPKVGINLSNQTLLDGDYKTGLTAGVFADYRFSNLFALSADVLYSRQGAKGDDAKIKTDNLNIPILANFYLVKGLAVKAGVQPGFLLGANDGMKDAFKTFDLAVPVGVSYDFNCGLKAYRNKVVKSIEVYGEMHRFIPLLAKSAGFRQIGEKVVQHRARKYGVSKFGWERMIKGYLDLVTVMFMSKFGKSPMYFFGGLGTLMFLVGGSTAIALIADKLYKQAHALPIRGVTDQPLFFIAITAVIIGVQLFLAGFLGELIGRNSGERNRYLIDERIEAGESQDADTETPTTAPSERKKSGSKNMVPPPGSNDIPSPAQTERDLFSI